jgi:aminopeptidase N
MLNEHAPHPIYLSDYAAPTFEVEHLNLVVKLFPEQAEVTCTLTLKRLDPHAHTLKLHGQQLTLKSLFLDDKPLTADQDFKLTDKCIELLVDRDNFTVTSTVIFDPAKNTSCTGLYLSNGTYCTQCESHGFRRIAYSIDRPDVMARFTTRIEADKQFFPQLLSNGNPIDKGDLPNGRHFVTWEDPFKKPTYLFALVAGNMHLIEDNFVTQSGRLIDLQIYVEKHNAQKADHAMFSLKEAMDWDEKNYGREYDLDIYMIVAVSTFNMGAMENKGLNIFNDKYIVADPQLATDTDYQNILQVVGHEYFHNWSGNRVTLRDWFQLSLKEGFTVFRDQCFGADKSSAAVRRIEDVRLLKTAQFNEDASPMAHPVRPSSYIEMNNFYTATVYEKGAELIRMQHTLLGPELFRKATDQYFEQFDGKAVTTDDFVDTMQAVSGIDLTQFRRWYEQSGTPELFADWDYDETNHSLILKFKQYTTPTPDQPDKFPLHIPVRTALLDAQGQLLTFIHDGHECTETVISITEPSQTIELRGVSAKPIPSLLRGFSAPVKSKFNYMADELLFLAIYDTDPIARYEALQQLYVHEMLELLAQKKPVEACPGRIHALFSAVLNDEISDPELLATMLVLPSENYLAEQIVPVPVDEIFHLRRQLIHIIADQFAVSFRQHYLAFAQDKYEPTQEAIAKRAFQHICLSYLCARGDSDGRELALAHYFKANNMTDTLTALRALNDHDSQERTMCLTDFYDEWSQEPLVIDKWLALQACARFEGVVDQVKHLSQHAAFNYENPNKVYSLFAQFGSNNPYYFHSRDGKGYQLITDAVLHLNKTNPQVAARIIKPLINYKRYDEHRQALMRAELVRIQQEAKLSPDLYEIVSKSLN